MTIIEALNLCQHGGHRVRPVCWRTSNPDHWIEGRGGRVLDFIFVECGSMEELPHPLRLQSPAEFLGEWETVQVSG